jgi:uncharacterized membrane protein
MTAMNVQGARKAFAWILASAVVASALPLGAMLAAASPQPLSVTATDRVAPQFGVTPGHSFAPAVSGRGYNASLIKWKLPLSVSDGATVVADFSSDVRLNNTTSAPDPLGVVFAYAGPVFGTSIITIAAGNNASFMWSYPVVGNVFATPVASDVNLDGKMDLVIRSDTGFLEAVTPNITWDGSNWLFPIANVTDIQAQQIWNMSLSGSFSTNNNLSTPIAADLLGSPAPDILAPAGDRLYLLDGATGAEFRNRTVDGTIVSAPTVMAFGSGWRVLVASTNRTTTNFSAVQSDFILTAFDGSLNFLWNASFPQWYDTSLAYKSLDLQLPSPAAGNLDGAGGGDDVALVTPYENSIARLRIFFNGSNTPGVNVSLAGLTGASPAVVDLNGDGADEVVALSYLPGTPFSAPNSQAYLEVFAGNGTRKWNATVDEAPGPSRENTLAPPAIADLNGDGVKDIVMFLTDGACEVRSGTNGSRILRHQTFDQATPTEFSGPAVADLDKDGFLDITANAAVTSFALADLRLNASDVALNNTQPEQFENVSITATVHNGGNTLASNVSVAFFDGALKMAETALPLILAGATAQAQVTVNFTGGGPRTLRVVADPNNTIEELDETNNTAVLTVNVTSLFGFRFESPVNRTAVQPGFAYAFILNAVSEGTQDNAIDITVGALPLNWSGSLNPRNLTVTPSGTVGDTNTSFVTITTDSFATQGEYDIVVTGASQNSARNSARIVFTIIIGGQYGVSLYPGSGSANVTAGDTAIYSFEAINSGNSPDTFDLTNTTAPAGWTVTLTRKTIALPATARGSFGVTVRAPSFAVQGENSTVTITARSQNDTQRNDTAVLFTTVVVPDLVVTSIQFYRQCGGEAFFGSPRLIQGETSRIKVTVANAADNAPISSVRVRFWVEGTFTDVPTRIEADGTGTQTMNFSYASPGLKSVTAEVDPGNLISESSESNNNLTTQVSVKDLTPVGDLTVAGIVTKGGQPVVGAQVALTDAARAVAIDTSTDGAGQYSILLAAGTFLDGDRLLVNATDGLDLNSTQICAYSEDIQETVDMELQLPSPYDFLLTALSSTDVSLAPGGAATFDVNVTNRGQNNNTIVLSASSAWSTRILDANGSAVGAVLLAPNASALVRVEVTAPPGAAPGESQTTFLNASTVAPPVRTRSLSFRATAGVLRNLSLTESAGSGRLLAGANLTVNLTVANLGNAEENVSVFALCSGPFSCSSWVSFDTVDFSIARGGVAVVRATVRVSPSATGGAYTINFTAAASNDSGVAARASFALDAVEVTYDFSVSGPSGIRLVPGQTRSTNLSIVNRGTVEDTYTVTTAPGSGGFTIALDPAGADLVTMTIPAGQSGAVTLSVAAPLEVDRESFQIDLAVDSVSHSAQRLVTISATVGFVYDFQVTSVRLSGPAEAGKEVQVFAKVANLGLRSFTGSLPVVFTVDGQEYGRKVVTTLGVGLEETVSFSWTPQFAGAINISVQVNPPPPSDIYESSFRNNAEAHLFTVSPQQPGGFLADRGVQIFLVAITGIVLLLVAVARRKETEQAPVDHEKQKEESDERRKGKGPGDLTRI